MSIAQIKVQAVFIEPIMSGKSKSGDTWNRRNIHVVTQEGVGVVPFYGTEKECNDLQLGHYMANLNVRPGERGRLDFVLGNLTPVQQPKQTQ